jgi:hypothetical protein
MPRQPTALGSKYQPIPRDSLSLSTESPREEEQKETNFSLPHVTLAGPVLKGYSGFYQ